MTGKPEGAFNATRADVAVRSDNISSLANAEQGSFLLEERRPPKENVRQIANSPRIFHSPGALFHNALTFEQYCLRRSTSCSGLRGCLLRYSTNLVISENSYRTRTEFGHRP